MLHRLKDEAGQTLMFSVVFFTVLMGFAAVVVDGGNYLLQKRNLQGVADAAALAGVKELPGDRNDSDTVARNYATAQNTADGASVQSVNFSHSDSIIAVTVQRSSPGAFMSFFGMTAPTIVATASAQVSQISAATGMLPFGLMKDSYTMNTLLQIRDDISEKRGLIYPREGSPCTPTDGGHDDRLLIEGEFISGGLVACADPPGTVIETASGWVNGNVKAGFDLRIGSNTDSFSDVFEFDASTGKYLVNLPNSPRIGMVPIVENTDGTTAWDHNKEIKIVGYLGVYIGKTDSPPDYPAYTNNGKEVFITAVDLIEPLTPPLAWEGGQTMSDYDAESHGPLVYRLIV